MNGIIIMLMLHTERNVSHTTHQDHIIIKQTIKTMTTTIGFMKKLHQLKSMVINWVK